MQVSKFSAQFRSLFTLIILTVCCASGAFAAHESIIYTFPGNPNGYSPTSALIGDAVGNLYGTTYTGGTGNCIFSGGSQPGCGAIVELTPPASGVGPYTDKVLYSFQGGTDGMLPYAGLVMDAAGNLYGAASIGGNGTFENNGTIYELSPPAGGSGPWTFTVLFFFATPLADGSSPMGTLVMDSGGNLYGTTESGGAANDGTVFELKPPSSFGGSWTESVLHSFSATDGWAPIAGLYRDGSGNLYGTTTLGGTMNDCQGTGCGVVFKLLPGSGGTWTELLLHRFNLSDGAYPYGTVTFHNGNFYGTTSGGSSSNSGYIFELTPGHGGPWTLTNIHRFVFNSGVDGSMPLSGVTVDFNGNLFGTTYGGGADPEPAGTVYELSPPVSGGNWTETVLMNFDDSGTAFAPIGGLLLKGNKLFGTTTDCNGTFFAGCGGYGNVFAISNFE